MIHKENEKENEPPNTFLGSKQQTKQRANKGKAKTSTCIATTQPQATT